MFGKELDIEEFSTQLIRIILFHDNFLNFFLRNLQPNTSSMFWITPIYES